MNPKQGENYKRGLELRAQNQAKKLREQENHRKGLGNWMGLTSAAMKALQDMDRADKKLAGMGLFLLLLATVSFGQGFPIPVLKDTNLLMRRGAGAVEVEWRTNLYEAETITFVTTNWMPVGPPIDVVTNGVVISRRQIEAATLLTNVVHQLKYGGVERRFIVSQTTGPVLATREHNFEPKLEAPPYLAVPPRQQR